MTQPAKNPASLREEASFSLPFKVYSIWNEERYISLRLQFSVKTQACESKAKTKILKNVLFGYKPLVTRAMHGEGRHKRHLYFVSPNSTTFKRYKTAQNEFPRHSRKPVLSRLRLLS